MTNQEVFLGILKQFIHPAETFSGIISEAEQINVEDWEQIIRLSVEHSVLPIIYEEAWKLTSFQNVPADVRAQLKGQVKRQVIGQMQKTDAFLGLYRELTIQGITPLIMKGLVCREMYTNPDYRSSGDEDLLVKKDEFSKLDQILLRMGFEREVVEDVETAHEITYFNRRSGLHLEVHLTLFPEESGAYGQLNEEFPQIFARKVPQMVQGSEVYTLDWTQHMLYLLCHGLKHFLHCGFGIRQLMDMVKFAETYGDRIDWEEVITRTKRQHMYVFWMNLFDIGERYLGFSWEKAHLQKPEQELLHSEDMLWDILDSGVYGHSTQDRSHSANITLQAADRTEQKRTGIAASLFPSMDYMSRQYPYLKEKKWLLPVAWASRIIAYASKTGGKGMADAVETGRRRVDLLKSYGIIEK